MNVTLSNEQIALLSQAGMPVLSQTEGPIISAQPKNEAPTEQSAAAQSVKYDRKGTFATAAIRGNVGQNPGMKGDIFMFTVATELSITDSVATRKYTDWHTVAVRNLANNASFIAFCQTNVKQGSRVLIKGRITSTKTGGIIIHATSIEVRQGNVASAKTWLASDGTSREYNAVQDETATPAV